MKKHHFDAFRHEKHFEKQLQPHSQTVAAVYYSKIYDYLILLANMQMAQPQILLAIDWTK